MITILTLMAGREYAYTAYLEGLLNIGYPKSKIHLLWVTNSNNPDFKTRAEFDLAQLTDYASTRFINIVDLPPSRNAFIEDGIHTHEHGDRIAGMYNRAIEHVKTDWVLFLEDDVVAPANAITGLLQCYDNQTGYACGVVVDRHGKNNIFMWDLIKYRVYPEGDSNDNVTYAAQTIPLDKRRGIQDIGLGHFGLTLVKKRLLNRLSTPIFKPRLARAGALIGCDMVFCIELDEINLKRRADYDVVGGHISTKGNIINYE